MKPSTAISISLLCLLLAGSAVWWQTQALAEKEVVEGNAESQDRPDALVLEPFVVPVLHEGQVTRQLTLNLTLQFNDPRVQDRALALMPRLQDALLQELHGLYSLRRVREVGFDSLLVHERLALASERILGAGEIAGLALSVAESREPGV